jgi:hypothetical protein
VPRQFARASRLVGRPARQARPLSTSRPDSWANWDGSSRSLRADRVPAALELGASEGDVAAPICTKLAAMRAARRTSASPRRGERFHWADDPVDFSELARAGALLAASLGFTLANAQHNIQTNPGAGLRRLAGCGQLGSRVRWVMGCAPDRVPADALGAAPASTHERQPGRRSPWLSAQRAALAPRRWQRRCIGVGGRRYGQWLLFAEALANGGRA